MQCIEREKTRMTESVSGSMRDAQNEILQHTATSRDIKYTNAQSSNVDYVRSVPNASAPNVRAQLLSLGNPGPNINQSRSSMRTAKPSQPTNRLLNIYPHSS